MLTTTSLADMLDRLYTFEIEHYVDECTRLKKAGYKIYRNDEGRHKVVEPARSQDMYNDANRYTSFNGIFGNRFSRG